MGELHRPARPRSDPRARTSIAAGAVEVGLTPGLVVLVVLLGVIAGLRPSVASPTVTALMWAGLFTMVVLGVLWPLLDRRSRRLVVRRCAGDVVEGDGFGVTVSLDRAGFPLQVQLDASVGSLGRGALSAAPAGGSAGAGVAGTGSSPGELFVNAGVTDVVAVLTRRGVYTALPVRVTDTGPFGLLRVSRGVHLRLPAPLYVAPRVAPSGPVAGLAGSANEPAAPPGVVNSGDTVRSVRPYVRGDPAHLVHWPTSAHAGELMVMELEPPADHLLVVVVDLRRAGGAEQAEAVENAVRLAAGAVQRGLDEAMRVMLCTAQPDGPSTVEVHDIRRMRRLLAAAVPGPPGGVPEGCVPVVFTAAASETPAGAADPGAAMAVGPPARGPHSGTRR